MRFAIEGGLQTWGSKYVGVRVGGHPRASIPFGGGISRCGIWSFRWKKSENRTNPPATANPDAIEGSLSVAPGIVIGPHLKAAAA
jgi:hypothetical protein